MCKLYFNFHIWIIKAMVTTVVIDSYTSYSVVVPRSAVLFVEIRVLAFYFDIYYIYINKYIYD